MLDWNNKNGSKECIEFNEYIKKAVIEKNIDIIMNYDKHKYSSYAVPTKEHYLPLIYCIGAANNYEVEVFNDVCSLSSISMTGFIFK